MALGAILIPVFHSYGEGQRVLEKVLVLDSGEEISTVWRGECPKFLSHSQTLRDSRIILPRPKRNKRDKAIFLLTVHKK